MLYRLKELSPKIAEDVFIALTADIIGDVEIGSGSSVWFHCTLRGDVFPIRIGKNSNIQDNSVIHVTSGSFMTTIKDNVTIGHRATIHGATLEDYSFIGMGATILDEAIVEPYGFVAAGALIPPRFKVPEKTLVAGVPAKVIRDLKPPEIDMIKKSAVNYRRNGEIFSKELKPLS